MNSKTTMNRLLVSAGLVALSAATLESAMADDDAAGPKYWSVGATLRGFYDDNIYTTSTKQERSFGFEVSPTVSAHVPLQQTDFGIRYTYGLYYYEQRQEQGQDSVDMTHQVDLWLDHSFNERWKSQITDTFAVGQEPELLTPNPVSAEATAVRANGDNISNHGGFALDTDWTRLFSTTFSYENGYYDYDQSGASVTNRTVTVIVPGTPPVPVTGKAPTWKVNGPTLAGILNRDEENVALDLKWHVLPETTAFVGYQFAWVNYLGGEPIAIAAPKGHPLGVAYTSSDRDSYTHYGYVGFQQDFTPNLSATAKVGGSYIDVYGDSYNQSTSWNPYADVSVSYTYMPGSYLQLGFTHDQSATDQVAPDASGNITQYSEDSVLYLDVNHRITSKLVASVIGRVQYTTYDGGAANNEKTTDWSLGLNLNYQINPHVSVDAGYNYDDVVSDLGGYGYDRNRVYLGVTANY